MRRTISFLHLSAWMWILIAAAPISMPAQAWMKAASAGDNYFLARQEAEQYYADNPQMVQDVSGGYKQFKRWEWFWDGRVDETGSYRTAIDAFLQYKVDFADYCNGALSIPTTWEQLGPITVPPRNTTTSPTYGSHGMGIIRDLWVNPVNPDIILAGSGSGGLFKTTNSGTTWTNITDGSGLATLGVHSLAVHQGNNNHIMIATGLESSMFGLSKFYGFGVIRTTDGGVTWEETGLSFAPGDNSPITNEVVFDNSDPNANTAFACAKNKVYRTTDGGDTWTIVLEGEALELFREIEVNPFNPVEWMAVSADGSAYGEPPTTGNVYRSIDGGIGWINITANVTPDFIEGILLEYSPAQVGIVYLYDLVGKTYKSTNAGTSWVLQGSNSFGNKGGFECSITDPNKLYGGGITLSQSADGGVTYSAISGTSLNATNYMHADMRVIRSVLVGTDEYIYVGEDGGVSRKKAIGEIAWTDLSGSGLAVSQIYGLSSGNSSKVYCGMQDLSTSYYDGTSWHHTCAGDGGNCIVNPFDPDNVYMCANGAIQKSTDGGVSYIGQNFGNLLVHDVPMRFHPTDPATYWAVKGEVSGFDSDGDGTNETVSSLRRWDPDLGQYVQLMDLANTMWSKMGRAKALAIAPSNPNRLYIASDGITWGDPLIKHVWRTSNSMEDNLANVVWTDITPGLTGLLYASIEEIVVDPHNADRLWVVFKNFWEGQKVYYSANAGDTWTNVSGNLPNMPVNCIEYHDGTNDGIYVGTDVGLFYKDATMTEWHCLSDGMPAMIITDIEINYCTNKLIVGTFGRGAYQIDLVNQTPELIIYSTTTYNYPVIAPGDIIINAPAKLTITDKLMMPEGSKIIVKPGAMLVVNGGTITNGCGLMWNGIEVWGTSTASQPSLFYNPNPNQGIVEIKNQSLIEHARCAIRVGHVASTIPTWEYDWSKTGGVIRASHSTFSNNGKAIEYLAYHNTNSMGNQSANRGYFGDCDFVVDDNIRDNNIVPTAISMWDVHGVVILGCRFKNEKSFSNWNSRGYGIYTAMSTYTVADYCTETLQIGVPCPLESTIRSEFTGWYGGIRSTGPTEFLTITAEHAIVQNNRRGFYFAGQKNLRVENCDFKVAETGYLSYGLYLNNSSGYEIEDNRFNGNDGEGTFGIVVSTSGNNPNEIYRNDFQDLTVGIQVRGVNRGSGHEGLQLRCNDFGLEDDPEAAQNDFAIHLWGVASIADYQGNLNEDQAAGNRFWPECDPLFDQSEREIHLSFNDDPSVFDYIHNQATLSPETVPLCRTLGVGLNDVGYEWTSAQCPVKSSKDKDKLIVKSAMEDAHSTYTSLRAAYDGYINNGTGPDLKVLLDDPTATSIELRNALLDASPKVSDEILLYALKRSPSMNGWHMAQVLIANSPLRVKVQEAVKKSEYQPFYVQLVLNFQNGTINTRNLMEMDNVWYQTEREINKNDLLRINALESEEGVNWSEIETLLDQYNYVVKEWQRIAFLIESGNLTTAEMELSACPSGLDQYCDLFTQVIEMQTDMDPGGLSQEVISSLSNLAQDEESGLGCIASGILEFWGAPEYIEPIDLPTGATKRAEWQNIEIQELTVMKSMPNPVSDLFQIAYLLPDGCLTAYINIFDSQGKLIKEFNAITGRGIIEMDASNLAAGIYNYELKVDDIVIAKEKISIVH